MYEWIQEGYEIELKRAMFGLYILGVASLITFVVGGCVVLGDWIGRKFRERRNG